MADFGHEDRFARVSIVFSFIALGLGGLFGLVQLITRTPYMPKLVNEAGYYTVLTGHGVLMAIVWTAFFIMGFAAYLVPRELGVRLSPKLLWAALLLSVAGTAAAATVILAGKATVLYTFYAPLAAHAAFYLGAAVLIIGTWIFAAAIFKAYLEWRRANKDKEAPIATLGVLATLIIWLEATPPLAFMVLKDLVPMALAGKYVDPLETRTYFWYFGHPLVYFWLVPAVAFWYYAIPRILGVRLFSRSMAKVAYILFIVASTPVGLHHQFMDPGISGFAKFFHTVTTYMVATPSLLTAFNLIATMERAGRAAGGRGFLGWVWRLPWGNPVFAGSALSLILFGFGGIGGIINASYTLNYIVHNTMWIVGHFHLTVGTAVTLTFMAASYALVPSLFGRELASIRLARVQPYLWFVGMLIFSLALHLAGLYGVPRRVYDVMYGGAAPASWVAPLLVAAMGGIVFWSSGALFLLEMMATMLRARPGSQGVQLLPAVPESLGRKTVLDSLKLWILIAVVLIAIGWSIPFYEIYSRGLSPVPPVGPDGIKLG